VILLFGFFNIDRYNIPKYKKSTNILEVFVTEPWRVSESPNFCAIPLK